MKPAQIRQVAAAALAQAETVAAHYLPDGKRQGAEWVGLNPRRADARAGSFSLNLSTGRWADFATGDTGGDVVNWCAYVLGVTQGEAAQALAEHLGLTPADDASERSKPRTLPKKRGDSGDSGDKSRNRQRSKKLRAPDMSPQDGDALGTVGTTSSSNGLERRTDPAGGAIVPIPAEPAAQLEASPPRHRRHGKPSKIWTYNDAEGRPLFAVCRFETADGKQILPLTWHADGWRWKGVATPRPLYGLDRLAARPDAVVLVAEGELAADAAGRLLPDLVAVTSPNGAQSAGRAEWAPLRGRRVRIWPDHDPAGRGYAADVARRVRQAGAVDVELLDLDALAVDPATGERRELPAGWDAADAEADGWNPARLAERARWLPAPGGKGGAERAAEADAKPSPFELREDGVYFIGESWDRQAKQWRPDPPKWICSPLTVAAVTRDVLGEAWGRLLEFDDLDGVPHRWAMPMSLLRGDGQELRGALLGQGLRIAAGAESRRHLTDYLTTARPETRARSVSRTGWHNGESAAFILPDRTLGEQAEPVYFQADSLDANPYRQRGDLADWREHVAALAVGNSRLVFAVSAGFAAALLGPAGAESGGFHLRGSSSGGKTTALSVACSVWGGAGYLERWRATDNALESVAAMHSDTLLVLDELAMLDPRVAGESAYLLAAGRAKQRSNRDGNLRAAKTWRLLFLSSGEVSLSDHAATAGKRLHAGADLRLADIPADAGAGLGVFEDLHGRADGHAFARELAEGIERAHGTAGPAFVEAIIARRHELPDLLAGLRAEFLRDALPPGASGQAARVCDRFALVAVAGELATAAGITGWPAGEAERAARRCFEDWARARGGTGSAETAALLRQVRAFFEAHGESRYTAWERADDDHSRRTAYRAGFSRQESSKGGLTLYTLPEIFRGELCAGFDYREAERVLVACGWLIPGTDGRPTRKERLPTFGNPVRCYVTPLAALGEPDSSDGEPAEAEG